MNRLPVAGWAYSVWRAPNAGRGALEPTCVAEDANGWASDARQPGGTIGVRWTPNSPCTVSSLSKTIAALATMKALARQQYIQAAERDGDASWCAAMNRMLATKLQPFLPR